MLSSREFKVTGKVRLPAVSKPFQNAPAHVRVEDISKMDIPSTVIASQLIDVSVSEREVGFDKESQFEFEILGEITDERNLYVVSVHVDVDCDGKISRGDYITTGLYPVLTRGNPDRIVVDIDEVK